MHFQNEQSRETTTKNRPTVIGEKDFGTVIMQAQREIEMVPLLLQDELSDHTQANIPV